MLPTLPPGWKFRLEKGQPKVKEGGESYVYFLENEKTRDQAVLKVPRKKKNEPDLIKSYLVAQDVAVHKMPGLESRVQHLTTYPYLMTYAAAGVPLGNWDFEGLKDITWVMKHMAVGVDNLHSLGWAHNDLNGANIIVDSVLQSVTIIDYGKAAPNEEPHADMRNWDSMLLTEVLARPPDQMIEAAELSGLVNDWMMMLAWCTMFFPRGVGGETLNSRSFKWVSAMQPVDDLAVLTLKHMTDDLPSNAAFRMCAYLCLNAVDGELDAEQALAGMERQLAVKLRGFNVPDHPSGQFEVRYSDPNKKPEGAFDVRYAAAAAQAGIPIAVKGSAVKPAAYDYGTVVKQRSYAPLLDNFFQPGSGV